MKAITARAIALVLFLCAGCDGATGFSLPDPSSRPTRVVGVAIWPDGPLSSLEAHIVVGRESRARVDVEEGGFFAFEDAPSGPVHIVLHAGNGAGAVRSVEIFPGGVNDVGEMFIDSLHLSPIVYDFRGIGTEERWSNREGSLYEIVHHPESPWFMATRYAPPGLSLGDLPALVAISRETGEEKVLEESFAGFNLRPTRDGVVFIDADNIPTVIDSSGRKTTGPKLPDWTSAFHEYDPSPRRYLAFVRRPTPSSDLSGVVILDLETLESREVATFESLGPYSDERLEELLPRAPWQLEIDARGEHIIFGRLVMGPGGQPEERLTRVDTATGQVTDLWSAPCTPRHSVALSCLLGFDLGPEGQILATIRDSGLARYLELDAVGGAVELEVLDASGQRIAAPCSDSRWVHLHACALQFGTNQRLYVDTPVLGTDGELESWRRDEILDGRVARTFDLGWSYADYPDGNLLMADTPQGIDVWSRRQGFLQVWVGAAGAPPDEFEMSTFLPADHRAVALSPDGTHVYYLVSDPETGYTQLFRAPVAGAGVENGGAR